MKSNTTKILLKMQTRKRNIDSVLDLVNPKRKKITNSATKQKVKEKQSNIKKLTYSNKETNVTGENKKIKSEPEKDDVKHDSKSKDNNSQVHSSDVKQDSKSKDNNSQVDSSDVKQDSKSKDDNSQVDSGDVKQDSKSKDNNSQVDSGDVKQDSKSKDNNSQVDSGDVKQDSKSKDDKSQVDNGDVKQDTKSKDNNSQVDSSDVKQDSKSKDDNSQVDSGDVKQDSKSKDNNSQVDSGDIKQDSKSKDNKSQVDNGDVKQDGKHVDSKSQLQSPGGQVTDKPFKKRPFFDEKEKGNTTDLSNAKVIEIVIHVQNVTSKICELPTVSLSNSEKEEDKKSIDLIHDVKNVGTDDKTLEDRLTKNDDKIIQSQNVEEIKQEISTETELDNKLGTTENNAEGQHDEETDNDVDDILDAGAIDDRRDKDYVGLRKEPGDKNMAQLSSNSATKIIRVEFGNVKPDTTDGTTTQITKPRFRCQFCDKYFHTPNILKNHMIRHTGGLPYMCDQCGMRFGQISNLKRHQETHMEDSDRPYACPTCNKTFKRKSDVDVHQIVHQDVKPFTCLICFKKFKREISLFNHLKVHQLGKTFVCDQCGMAFGYRSTLEGHLKTHSDTKAFKCTLCGKGFNSKQSFNDHMLRHDKIKEVECPICKRKYYNTKELRKHMPFHLNVTNHQCEPCKMFFNDAHSLRIHNVKSHSDSYNCDFCDKCFKSRRAVKSHIFHEHRELRNARKPKMALHEKANFKHVLCDFCGKELSNKYRLKKHLIAKHSGKKMVRRPPDPSRVRQKLFPSGMKVLCTVCNKVMFNKYKLFTHMQKIHDIPVTDIKDIQLVSLEGEDRMIKKVGLDKDSEDQSTCIDLDGQPIILKPESGKTVRLVDQVSQPGASTIHYLDAHGNIIYTDVSSDKRFLRNYLEYDNDNYQIKSTNHSVDDDSKGFDNEGFKNNIVDYAAKAAKIIEDMSTVNTDNEDRIFIENSEEVIIFDKHSNAIVPESNSDFDQSSDITYIVQQATDRIAAHEKAVDAKSVMNLGSNNAIEDDVRLIVSESVSENVENPNEAVQYVIEDGNINTGEIGYLVKEGLNETLNDGVVFENYVGDQEQKIIIIDEHGGEQMLSTGSNDLIKITYDPESGLYTYFTEEVEVKQEESTYHEHSTLEDSGCSMIIKEEEQQVFVDRNFVGVVSNEVVECSENRINNDITSDQHGEQVNETAYDINEDKQLNLQNADQQNSTNLLCEGVISSEAVLKNDHIKPEHESGVSNGEENKVLESISEPKSFNIQGQNYEMQTSEELITGVISLTKSQEGSMISEIDTDTSGNDMTLFLPKSNDTLGTEMQNSDVTKSDLVSSFQSSSLQHLQTYETIINSPNFLNTTASMPISSTFVDQVSVEQAHFSSDAPELYEEQPTVEDSQVSEQEQLLVSDSSNNILEDVSQNVVISDQSHEPLKADFSSFTYQNNIPVKVSEEEQTVTDPKGNVAQMEGQTNDPYYLPVETASANLIDADASNKKDFVHLENMLKSGIKDASNTEEYTNFLDRMINHLQSAKDSAVGQPGSDN